MGHLSYDRSVTDLHPQQANIKTHYEKLWGTNLEYTFNLHMVHFSCQSNVIPLPNYDSVKKTTLDRGVRLASKLICFIPEEKDPCTL
jgi:hypothetical protein